MAPGESSRVAQKYNGDVSFRYCSIPIAKWYIPLQEMDKACQLGIRNSLREKSEVLPRLSVSRNLILQECSHSVEH